MIKALADTLLSPGARFLHERLRMTPNAVSVLGFAVACMAAALVAAGYVTAGMAVMAASQIIDGMDGAIARIYNLQSTRGKILDVVFDRLGELAMFLALWYAGLVSLFMVIMAFTAILLVTAVEPFSGFDPGFKRFILYFGWIASVVAGIQGFQIALHVVFIANIAVVAVGTVIAEYRLQKEVDEEALRQRALRQALGSPPPEDPPSFLSRLVSWL